MLTGHCPPATRNDRPTLQVGGAARRTGVQSSVHPARQSRNELAVELASFAERDFADLIAVHADRRDLLPGQLTSIEDEQNVASGQSVPLSGARQDIGLLAGTEVSAQRRVAQPSDIDATTADLAKAGELLGYQPKVDLGEGLRRQWEWLAARECQAGLATAEATP